MEGNTLLCFLVLLLGSSVEALTEWQNHSFEIGVNSAIVLPCSPTTRVVVRNAIYRSQGCTCGSCQDENFKALEWATHELEGRCNGKTRCETRVTPFSRVPYTCHKRFVDIEYGCVKNFHRKTACGQTHFSPAEHGFVTNDLYPEPSDLRRCSVIFRVGLVKQVALRPMLVNLPTSWSLHFCNHSICKQINISSFQGEIALFGNSYIKMSSLPLGQQVDPSKVKETGSVKFHFEYQVISEAITTTTGKTEPPNEKLGVGVIRRKTSYAGIPPSKIGAIAAGVSVPSILIALFAGIYVYKNKSGDREKKLGSESTSNSSITKSRDVYYKDVLRHRASVEPARNTTQQ